MSAVVGIDASRAVVSRRTGTENYSLQLIRAISELDHRYRLRLYYPSDADGSSLPQPNTTIEHRPVPGSRLWTHRHLASELRNSPVDLLFVPAHVIPLIHPATVVTVHDLGYMHRPGDHPIRQRWMLKLATRWNVRAARRIIVPSQFTADDIVRHYPTAGPKLEVIPHGVDTTFEPATDESINDTLRRRSVNKPYVLSVGTVQPRKDYRTLVEAIALYNQHRENTPVQLVIAGRPGWLVERVLEQMEPFRQSARLTVLSDVNDSELPALYSGALAYAQPSRFEGFGMPVLEAMACGVPVIYATGTSMPEVAGDAGLAFPVGSATHLAECLRLLASRPDLRRELASRGIERAKLFSWHSSAAATLAVIERAMAQS